MNKIPGSREALWDQEVINKKKIKRPRELQRYRLSELTPSSTIPRLSIVYLRSINKVKFSGLHLIVYLTMK